MREMFDICYQCPVHYTTCSHCELAYSELCLSNMKKYGIISIKFDTKPILFIPLKMGYKGRYKMRKIIFNDDPKYLVLFEDLKSNDPIFAFLDNVIIGMVIFHHDRGWVVKIGGSRDAYDPCNDLKTLIKEGLKKGYTFFTSS